MTNQTPTPLLKRAAALAVAYNLAVILFGAWVRITGSGAGCGEHWPSCNGEVIPRAPSAQTVIEFTHRTTSGLALLVVVALAVVAFRTRPAGHRARKAAVAMLVFVLLEAAVGAGLVLFGLTAKDDSAARAIVIAIHLVNTLGLLASGLLTLHFAEAGPVAERPQERGWISTGLGAVAVASATGAVTALGDTLFPVGTAEAAAAQGHFLVSLRIVHPIVAIVTAALITIAARKMRIAATHPATERAAKLATALVHTQVLIGGANILLSAPGWMQIIHLLLANLAWLALVRAAATRVWPLPESAAPVH